MSRKFRVPVPPKPKQKYLLKSKFQQKIATVLSYDKKGKLRGFYPFLKKPSQKLGHETFGIDFLVQYF